MFAEQTPEGTARCEPAGVCDLFDPEICLLQQVHGPLKALLGYPLPIALACERLELPVESPQTHAEMPGCILARVLRRQVVLQVKQEVRKVLTFTLWD